MSFQLLGTLARRGCNTGKRRVAVTTPARVVAATVRSTQPSAALSQQQCTTVHIAGIQSYKCRESQPRLQPGQREWIVLSCRAVSSRAGHDPKVWTRHSSLSALNSRVILSVIFTAGRGRKRISLPGWDGSLVLTGFPTQLLSAVIQSRRRGISAVRHNIAAQYHDWWWHNTANPPRRLQFQHFCNPRWRQRRVYAELLQSTFVRTNKIEILLIIDFNNLIWVLQL